MTAHLVNALDCLSTPRLLVLGDLILDRYTWGDAERISPEAPVPVLRADQEEVRLGGAASVAFFLRSLEAQVILAGVIGDDGGGRILRKLLEETAISCQGVLYDADRFTTVKERFMGRAAQRHPQQILRVDREQRHALSTQLERRLAAFVVEQVPQVQALLVSDYGKGVCTSFVMGAAIAAANQHQVPILIDPCRTSSYERYRGATLLTPNRVEAELASGVALHTTAAALQAGEKLCREYDVEAVLVKLDSDGMVLVQNGQSGELFSTRPRAVYDVTGAGDMVLAMTGLCRACGISWEETVPLANVAAGLEVEKLGVAPVTRSEILADLTRAGRTSKQKMIALDELLGLVEGHRRHGKKIVFTNGCFDLLHIGHAAYLEEAALLGDVLIVAVNSDRSVRQVKGLQRPVIGQAARATLVAALACVDYAIIFDEETPCELLRGLRPDVLAKGGTYTVDQVVGKEIVESYGGQVRVVAYVDGVSTTNILAAVQTNLGLESSWSKKSVQS